MWGWVILFVIAYFIYRSYQSFKNSLFGKLLGWMWKPFSFMGSLIPAPMANKAHVVSKQMSERDDLNRGGCGVYTPKCW